MWPGDVLAITANGQTLNVVARQVVIANGNAVPELVTYHVTFANDWAESLGITLSEAIAPDAFLPPAAEPAPAQVLANLQQLTVTSATASALQIDAGVDPPVGGGFEVRLRDWDFGPGVDQNLVLRSPVRVVFDSAVGAGRALFYAYVRCFHAAALLAAFQRCVH